MATVKADNLDVTPTKPKDDSSKAGSTDIRKVATTTQAAGNNTRKARKPAEKSAWLTKATGNLLKEFDPVALEAGSTEVTSSAGFDLVSTYNWNLGKVPSIYVPGAPPLWTPVELPKTLPKDSGTHFTDQNAAKVPTYPFEPVFGALSMMNPNFDFSNVDLVTNRNSLRKLLDFSEGRAPDSFRIELNLLQDTLLLTRRERNTRELIHGNRNSGFGHNFERAFTQPEVGIEDSSSHHRIIQYTLGDLICVVRFEVDTWLQGDSDSEEPEIANFDTASLQPKNDLQAAFASLSLTESSQKEKKKKPAQYQPTRTIPRGHFVPSSRIAEIKARSGKHRLNQMIPQLWFGRTPHLFIGSHKDGTFTDIDSIHLTDHFPDWEKSHQDGLRKMARLIADLRETVRAVPGGACVAVCNHKVRPLRLAIFSSVGQKPVLPDDIVCRYWRRSKGL